MTGAAGAWTGPGIDAGPLLAWYRRVRRPLPWRFTRDPWAILVSEVMLQQTQAARVVPYWERFLARFPEPAAAASAPVAEVLELWSGLGYNRRALWLREAAARVVADGWPTDAAGLRALPGVGAYTAAAVASFAFDEQVLALDTNVRRVAERAGGLPVIPPGAAAEVNQALMELGATVCGARSAACAECPVRPGCAAAAAGGPVIAPRRRGGTTVRFEDTDRWLRGRVVAALLAGDGPPEVAPDRLERVLAGLERDGLVRRDRTGAPLLPGDASGPAHDGRMTAADFDLVLEDPSGP